MGPHNLRKDWRGPVPPWLPRWEVPVSPLSTVVESLSAVVKSLRCPSISRKVLYCFILPCGPNGPNAALKPPSNGTRTITSTHRPAPKRPVAPVASLPLPSCSHLLRAHSGLPNHLLGLTSSNNFGTSEAEPRVTLDCERTVLLYSDLQRFTKREADRYHAIATSGVTALQRGRTLLCARNL